MRKGTEEQGTARAKHGIEATARSSGDGEGVGLETVWNLQVLVTM